MRHLIDELLAKSTLAVAIARRVHMVGAHEELDLIGQRSYDGDLRSESGQPQLRGELAVVVRFERDDTRESAR